MHNIDRTTGGNGMVRRYIGVAAVAVLLSMLVTAASAENLVVKGNADGYQVTMAVRADNLPVVGTNQAAFYLRDSSDKEVSDIVDVGVTYEVAGFMPRKIMSLTKTGNAYSGTFIITKAALYDVFFVFERRGEKQHVVRLSFQTKDSPPGPPQNK